MSTKQERLSAVIDAIRKREAAKRPSAPSTPVPKPKKEPAKAEIPDDVFGDIESYDRAPEVGTEIVNELDSIGEGDQ